MTKADTQILKGIAILLMIFLHLFNHLSRFTGVESMIYIGDKPLAYILTEACNPVPFFLILSGYGLYKVWEKGDKNKWNRILKLYIHLWIILIIFVAIGHFKHPNLYPGSALTFILNFFAISFSYNAELWFLFPYIILSILSPLIFKIINRHNSILIILLTLLLFGATSIISRTLNSHDFNNAIFTNILISPFRLLFNFCLGAIAAKTLIFEKVKIATGNQHYITFLAWGGVIILIVFNCTIGHNYFFAFLMITCILLMRIPKIIRVILSTLGDNSMNMWFIHTWFCYYLFREFIYSFKFPLVIFLVLTLISYICSLAVNQIALPIERMIIPRKEIEEKPML